MGSCYELSLAHCVIDRGKAYLPEDVMLPFQMDDRVSAERAAIEAPHCYQSNVQTVARRLDLLGFSLPAARRAFEKGVGRLQERERKAWPKELLQRGGFEAWLDAMTMVLDAARRLEHLWPETTEDERVKAMLTCSEHMFGFPHGEPLLVLRAILAVASPDDAVSLDFDDLVTGGYVSDDENLWSIEAQQPLIVLTEGKSDSRLLRESLGVLLPEFKHFITFIDFETANAKGGTDELVQFVRMFIGCGIRNRIVVLFDNDAAGQDALQRLLAAPLPPHVFVMALPPLEHARSYPTLGPDGLSTSDIDGRACSIELYLGTDVLTGDDGQLLPVRWTGFNEKAKRYQGQITNKGIVQKRFEEKLAAVQMDSKKRSSLDFSGVLAIFELIFQVLATR